MLGSIWQDVKREFSYGNRITQLIIINLAVFLVVLLIRIQAILFVGPEADLYVSKLLHWFEISSNWKEVLFRPWTIITHFFLHQGFWHFLSNMLFLYYFGRIFGDLAGNQRVLPLYIYGGLAGMMVFFVSANVDWALKPYIGHYALGASAAVLAIATAAATLAPDYNMRLILIGNVKLKYIVAFLLVLDLVSITQKNNTGGHLAHLGGAFTGWLVIYQLQRGNDWTLIFNNWWRKMEQLWSREIYSPKPKVVHRSKNAHSAKKNTHKAFDNESVSQEKIDQILDKIRETGYESLSTEEKDYLFKASKQ